MNDSCEFTSMDATSLLEFVGKTVVVRTKQQYTSKGVVHTVDPVTKRILNRPLLRVGSSET
ncbi:Inosine-5'-monophosphate dehydrogenase [Aphis craccivora]|uniref:Inosine-5'-monophosphate dehydrogenase n=1 Tax=Aphis craccivora TaxID=307492 RepID=A0A6G0VYD2_APHCR|nr:Inosine-5'-monophosphate dehydrogenase [Aphis craccivora]